MEDIVSDDAGDRYVAYPVLRRELAEGGAAGGRGPDERLMLRRKLALAWGGVAPGRSIQVPNNESAVREDEIPYGTDETDPRPVSHRLPTAPGMSIPERERPVISCYAWYTRIS